MSLLVADVNTAARTAATHIKFQEAPMTTATRSRARRTERHLSDKDRVALHLGTMTEKRAASARAHLETCDVCRRFQEITAQVAGFVEKMTEQEREAIDQMFDALAKLPDGKAARALAEYVGISRRTAAMVLASIRAQKRG